MIAGVQFDTIYHEHFFYWSLHAMTRALAAHGLTVMRAEELPTHGGSLRVHSSAAPHGDPGALAGVQAAEAAARLDQPEGYAGFAPRVGAVLDGLRRHLRAMKGRRVAAYGAAAKGNTLLNYCGIGREHVTFVVDRNPTKQGRLLPGSHIPVRPPDALFDERPDYVLVLPWNLIDEISTQLAPIRAWGGRLVTAIPEIRVS
jgi:hypothetical protein